MAAQAYFGLTIRPGAVFQFVQPPHPSSLKTVRTSVSMSASQAGFPTIAPESASRVATVQLVIMPTLL